jgi:cytochrome c oxidase cbb3-type subunit 3
MRRWLVAAAVVAAAACDRPQVGYLHLQAAPRPNAAAVAARHERGRAIYNFRCYYCHGYSGDARTLAARFLEPPPRDFTQANPNALSRASMLEAIENGRPGTGMKSFRGVISRPEMGEVVDFVRREFMIDKARNTRYHTAANGWPDHQRYAAAFPFATGEIALDTPWDALSSEQVAGKRLFLSTCVSCHDRSRVIDLGPAWDARPLSYPRNQYAPGADAVTSASVYAQHDIVPVIAGLTPAERRGEQLFQANCAFCHAADGTGKNWIGSFMEPHPRNLTDPAFMSAMTRERLRQVIRDGLPNTSMPAWKSVLAPDEIDAVIAYVSRAFHPVAP